MEGTLFTVFEKLPEALPLYEAFEAKMKARYNPLTIKISKTQVGFSNRYGFAYAWLPIRKMKNLPKVYFLVSFGLGYHLAHPRIVEAVEAAPRRWTHHVVVQSVEEMDEELFSWLDEAYEFSMFK